MPYVSFSLKYRPKRFDDVVGQQHVAKTLKNALANDRVAHAYLFTGPRGTGKTSTARILAAALNCVNGPTPEPCGECDMCRAIIAGNAMDVIEMDAGSTRGIDDIRNLREKVKFAPAEGRYKIYILDEAHQLTLDANNALLKTLEEPPKHVVFLLLTTEAHKIIPTILSRCQHFEFRTITLADIVGALRRIADEEHIVVDDAALLAIAHAADGAMRDAQSIFDQIVAYSEGAVDIAVVNEVLGVTERKLLSRVTDEIIAGNVAACFASVDQAIAEGKDLVRMVEDLTIYLRDLLRLQVGSDAPEALRMSAEATEEMRNQAQALGEERLLAAVKALAELQSQLKRSSQHALLVEVALAALCRPAQTAERPAIASRAEAAATRPRPAAQAPAPTPEAAAKPKKARTRPPVVDAGVDLHLSAIAANWDQMTDELKRMGHMPVSAILREGRPIAFEADTITVGFQTEFHVGRIQEGYKSLVEQAASQLFGRQLQIKCEFFDDPEDFSRSVQAASGASGPPAGSDAAPDSSELPPTDADRESKPAAAAQAEPETALEQGDEVPLTADRAVAQTLDLFSGSTEITDDETEP